jgi:hypothetical protein
MEEVVVGRPHPSPADHVWLPLVHVFCRWVWRNVGNILLIIEKQ